MKKSRIYTCRWVLSIALLIVSMMILNASDLHPVGARKVTSRNNAADAKQFVGCWAVGSYSLYIAEVRGEVVGKIRCNCEDPQRIYDTSVEGNTLTGRWESDPHFGPEKKKRRGLFMMTLSGNSLNGTAKESDESEVESFRGKEWPWNWTRQKDTKMCDDAK
jgi:hypothetical protein